MKARLDMNKIARALRAERRGRVAASGGYYGALQLLADIEAQFRVPLRGGRATNPDWTERRLVPLTPRTLRCLEVIAERVNVQSGVTIEPQVAAFLLEKTAERLTDEEVNELGGGRPRKSG